MEITRLIIQILTTVLGCLAPRISILVFLQLHWPSPALWIVKLFASALSPVFALIGLLNIIVGLTTGPVYISFIGIYVTLFFFLHVYRVTRPPGASGGFEQAFSLNWANRISADQKNHFLPRRIIKLY